MRENNKLIVVLGMHRSGTSAITRGLQVMGVGLGDRLMPPSEDVNAKGFWEDIDLNALNIEMLSAIGSDWHHLAPIKPGDVDILCGQGYFLRAVELLRQKFSNAPTFGFKDPRVTKLLPFWKAVFSHCQFDVSYVMTVRHPLSVVKSLTKRDGLEAEKSYLLWLEHVITSLSYTAGDKRMLVDYDRVMQSPDHELNRIAKSLGLEIDPTELQYYKTEFLDEELRHTIYSLSDLSLDDACPPLVREIYATLLSVASDHLQIDDLVLQNQVLQWSGELGRIKSLLTLTDRFSMQIANLKQAEKEAEHLHVAVEAERRARETEHSEAVKQIQALTEWATSADVYAKSKVEEAEHLHAAVEAERRARETEHSEAVKQIQALTEWATSADVYAKSKVEEAEHLHAAVEAERRARETEHSEAVKQIQALTEWATSADVYAKSKVEEAEHLHAAVEAERRARETEHSEAVKQIQALTEWATSADVYAKSKVEEAEHLHAAVEAERRARETERNEATLKLEILECQLMAYQSHWIFKILPTPQSTERKSE